MNSSPALAINGDLGSLPPSEMAEMNILLRQLLEKVEHVERKLDMLDMVAEHAPGVISMVTDTVDELYASANHAGIDLNTRVQQALALLERLTQPEIMNSLNTLLNNISLLENLVSQAPGMTAIMVDALDELYAAASQSGFDLETLARNSFIQAKQSLDIVQSASKAKPVNLFGLLRALSDPDVQRTTGFFLSFAKSFSKTLPQ